MTDRRDSDDRPRILQVITHLGLGGAERVAFALVRGLREQFRFGVYTPARFQDTEVGRAMRDELARLDVPWFTGSSLPMKYGGLAQAAWRTGRVVRDFAPDLVHLHTEIPEATYATASLLRPSLMKPRVARTIHNSIYWNPHRRLGRFCERRLGGHIACVSESARDAHRELRDESTSKPLPAAPRVIHNGVEVPRHEGRERGDRDHAVDRNGSEIRLLYAARFEPQKGADLLPSVLRQAKPPEGRAARLVIYGQGSYASSIEQLTESAPAGWTVEVHPPTSDLLSRMSEFDLMLMPSRYEGLSLLAMESLLLELPVVATRAPGLRENFPPDYPWLAEPGDAASFAELLHRVLADPSSWGEVARNAAAFAQTHFTARAMCDRYAAFYHDVLSR